MLGSNHNNGSTLGAFIAGAALGMVTALLIAPKSGEETREDIKNAVNDFKDSVTDKVSSGAETAKTKLSEAVDTTKTVATEGKRAAKEAKDRVKAKQARPDYEEE